MMPSLPKSMKTKPTSYLYNFYTKDDDDGTPIVIEIDGFEVQIGINVVILPGFHIKPNQERKGQLTVIGSNSFLGKGESIEEGSIWPDGTILQGEPLFKESLGIKALLVADDFGRTPENNAATMDCLKKELLHHVSFMANRRENSEQASSLVGGTPYKSKVGLHFNLTEGYSLSPLAKDKWYSVNEPGNLGRIINSRRSSFFLLPKEKKQILDELKHQIAAFKEYGYKPDYFDSHGNIHFKWPIAKTIYKNLKDEGFKYIRIPRNVKSKHKIYDLFFKQRVIKLYKRHFQTADVFLNASDLFTPSVSNHFGKTIEVMVHPFIKGERYINRRDVGFGALMAYLRAIGAEPS